MQNFTFPCCIFPLTHDILLDKKIDISCALIQRDLQHEDVIKLFYLCQLSGSSVRRDLDHDTFKCCVKWPTHMNLKKQSYSWNCWGSLATEEEVAETGALGYFCKWDYEQTIILGTKSLTACLKVSPSVFLLTSVLKRQQSQTLKTGKEMPELQFLWATLIQHPCKVRLGCQGSYSARPLSPQIHSLRLVWYTAVVWNNCLYLGFL